ncbi:hypothetical protein LTR62_006118 [Meristemomyces frigidus]|uniref:BCAS3 domain-containing protein n=1 Tax=Meristemomyces frigidus TaxID=1508187 RepID=A0AAN7TCS7_9PEZI|nr:hypothetical protein LTR62_006118 [Meristemomyces frigidus]
MPSTNDDLLDIDDDERLQNKPLEAPSSSAPATSKKDKKKKKRVRDTVKPKARVEYEEDSAEAQSGTPSPPLQANLAPTAPPPAPLPPAAFEAPSASPGNLTEITWDDETTVAEEAEPVRPEIKHTDAQPRAIKSVFLPSPAPPPAPLSPPAFEAPLTSPGDLVDTAWDDETTAAEEAEPDPPTVKRANVRSPAIKPVLLPSPRPAAAKPALPSPPTQFRPANLGQPLTQYTPRHSYRTSSMSTPIAPTPPRRDSYSTQQRLLAPRTLDPPPPHMPQPHFFGLPDLGLGLAQKQEQGQPAGSDGYCCRFDSFADAGDAASARKARDALLVGSERALDVYKVLSDRMELAGRLEGLRGAVIDAKVLPHNAIDDTVQELRPLVAVIVHGPVKNGRDQAISEEIERVDPSLYQTVVEVYSLRAHRHIATLYQSTTVRKEKPVMGHLSLPPKPVGELTLQAAGRFVTVSSGKSGEVFVFTAKSSFDGSAVKFCCLSKYWTAAQRRLEASRPATAAEGSIASSSDLPPRAPVVSLSNRWLAILPPYTTPSMSIQGMPLSAKDQPAPYGVGTHVAPSQPLLTCEVAGIDAESTLDWLSRRAAQGLVAASQKGYELGVQGWKELTHPSPPSTTQKPSSDPSIMFPPTNGPSDDPRRLANEPAIVSIIDLQRLLEAEEQGSKQAPAPLATFALVEGCNFLSFSPDGLRLLTSNRRGDMTSVWSLANIACGSLRTSKSESSQAEQGPHVKLMLRMGRSSPSVAVESVWSRDGDWMALLTTHGTIHLHETPLTILRKRKRYSTINVPALDKAEPTVSLSQGLSPPSNGFLGNLRAWGQSVSTGVNAVKTQYALPTTFAGFRETAAAARTAGRRAVAKGLRESYSAARSGVGDMWHAEDNKIRVRALQDVAVKSGCTRWVHTQSGASLAVVAGGIVHLHPVQRVMRLKGDARVSGLKKDKKSRDFPLPRISTIRDGSGMRATLASCDNAGPHGFWSLRLTPSDESKSHKRGIGAPVAAAGTGLDEVETNPPYCPFHVDPRVSIFAFEEGGYGSQADVQGQLQENVLYAFKTQGHDFADEEEAWMFGGDIPASRKLNEGARNDAMPAQHDAFEDDDVDEAILSGMVESRLTLRPAGQSGRQEIHVDSRPSRRTGSALMEEVLSDDMLEDDDSMM